MEGEENHVAHHVWGEKIVLKELGRGRKWSVAVCVPVPGE